MKVRLTFTIEEDIANWLKQFPNASEKVNEILRNTYENQANPFNDYLELEKQRSKINSKIKPIIEKLELVLEEGDKKQREQAEKLLKDFREQESKINAENKKITEILKECCLYDELLSCKDLNDVFVISRKLKEMNIKNPFTKLGNFGAMFLRDVSEYNGHFIEIGKPKEEPEEKEPSLEVQLEKESPLKASEELNPFELEVSP